MANKTDFLTKFTQITNISLEESIKLLSLSKKQVLVLNKNNKDFEKALTYINKVGGLEEIKEIPGVYLIHTGKKDITASAQFKEGMFYIQNLSSLIPVLALNPTASDTILDMCAAPGGKTFNICNMSLNKADVYVNEANRVRVQGLKEVITMFNLNIKDIYTVPAQGLYHVLNNKFTKILIDAPCSSEGLINLSDEKTLKYWNQKKVKQLRNLQKKIIASAYKLLAPGGTLVYSTCTYSPEENEVVVNYILKTAKDLEIQTLDFPLKRTNFVPALTSWNEKALSSELTKCIRILPTDIFEGFFVCKLTKAKL